MAGLNNYLYNNGGLAKPKVEETLGSKELMENLHIKDKRTLVKLINETRMPYIKIGNEYVVKVSHYEEWYNNNVVC